MWRWCVAFLHGYVYEYLLSQLLTDLQHICCQSSSLSSTLWQVALEFPHSVMEVIHTAWRSILFFTAWWSILFTVDRFKISLWKISQPHITRIHEFLTNMIIDNRLHNPMIWLSAPSCFLLAWHFYWIYDVCEMLPTFSAGNWLFNDLISDIFPTSFVKFDIFLTSGRSPGNVSGDITDVFFLLNSV